jgi:4-methylaminobutanoate oxidase (formaldehyde-forming)
VAHWILHGRPDADVTGMNIDRIHRYQTNPEYRRLRTVEALGMVYQCHYPGRSMQTARGARRSPVHDRLAAKGAYFRDVSGWEGADFYGLDGRAPTELRYTWGKPAWFEPWKAEHEAARSGVILMDMSFMAKFLVQGRDAGRVLNRLSTADVDGEAGRITYTQWLNEGGTLEADLTVTKLDEERYWVVASDTAHRHVETWMRRHLGDAHATVTDVTGGYAQLNVQGPRSRELLQKLTSEDLSNAAYPFRTAREIDLHFARVLCTRITYLGELGYELFVPSEQALDVYEALTDAGRDLGLRHAGLKALASLRMEKGYRDYGHDIDNTDSILEVGLGFTIDWKKPDGFVGKEAVLAKKAAGPLHRKLVQVILDDPEAMLFHAEIVYADGEPVGYVRAASYGFTLGGAVGLAMIDAGAPLDAAWIAAHRFEVDVAGTRVPAKVSLRPLFDPENARIKA